METNHNWNYNYILYNAGTADRWEMYGELRKLSNVRMCKCGLPGNNPFLNKLHKLHWSAKIYKKVKLPFKPLWFRSMTNGKFQDNKPVCYITFGGIYCNTEPRLMEYIKKKNPENKIVVHYRDIVKNTKGLEILKGKADLITSFDKEDAKKNNIVYMDRYAYGRLAETTEPEVFENDLYFVGYAKDRLQFLYDIFDTVTAKGIRCCFKLAGVPAEQRRDTPGLIYLDKRLPYTDIIQDVLNSRCILEIEQGNATGPTMRTFEAVTYKRKLLTNRHDSDERKHFDDEQIREINSAKDIDFEFLKSPIPYEKLKNVDDFSPIKELEFIEDYLINQNK